MKIKHLLAFEKLEGNLTVEEVAEILGYSESVIRRKLRRGEIKGFKDSKRWLVPPASIEEYAAGFAEDGFREYAAEILAQLEKVMRKRRRGREIKK